MSLLRRIQDATIDPSFQLADILRMCKILAARLEHPAFKEWISQELNNYENPEQLPDYRVLQDLNCRGHFYGPFNSGLKNALIPSFSLPEDFQELISTQHVTQSVSSLENVVNQANQQGKSILRSPWSADAVALLGSDIYERMVCGQAWTDIPTSCLVGILDTVKSRILDFVLEIETEAPGAGEVKTGEKPLSDGIVNIIFDRCILNHNHQTALPGSTIQTYSEGTQMSDNYVNNFQGANIANMANTVQDNARQQANQYIHLTEQKKTLAEAANEIQQLLKQLEKNNPTATETEKIIFVNDETTPNFKRRVVGALQSGGEAVIEEFLDNSYVNVGKAIVKGWIKPK